MAPTPEERAAVEALVRECARMLARVLLMQGVIQLTAGMLSPEEYGRFVTALTEAEGFDEVRACAARLGLPLLPDGAPGA